MGKSVIVDAVSEMCRARMATHILISPEIFKEYSDAITEKHVRAGIRRGTCHGVGIIVIEGLTDKAIFTFGGRKTKGGKQMLNHARREDYDKVIELIDAAVESGYRWISVGQAPTDGEEYEAT